MADAEFRYAVLLPAGADDTPYLLDLVAQGAQDPAVRLRVRLLVAGFGGIEDAEDALPEPQTPGCGAGEPVIACILLGALLFFSQNRDLHLRLRPLPRQRGSDVEPEGVCNA